MKQFDNRTRWIVVILTTITLISVSCGIIQDYKYNSLQEQYQIVSAQLIEHQNCIEYLNAPEDIRHTIDILTDNQFNTTCINHLWKN